MTAHSQTDSRTPFGRRILALWFPYLGTERIMRQRLGNCWRSAPMAARAPLLISYHEKNAQRIAALDEQAERLGLKVGMGVADARAMHPAVEIIEADPAADHRLLEGLADWCDRYTPLVAFDGADGLFLDITGCAHLFGGEKPLLEEMRARFFQQGFEIRAGLASTAGAAWAAAHFLGSRIVADGDEKDLLARLPLAALRLDPAVQAGLESVGLRLVGMLMQAPRAPLARRFGKMLLIRLDQALGRLEEAISPRLPVAPLSVERQLTEPVLFMDAIEGLILVLAGSLKADLERRNEGARLLQLLLFRVDGMVTRITVSTSRALREPHVIGRLFHERLAAIEDQIDAGCGFALIRLSVLSSVPFEGHQTDLASSTQDQGEDLALFADRVRARHGDKALLRGMPVESHIPERAVSFIPFAEAGRKAETVASRMVARSPRPIRLFAHPEPVEVIAAEIPEGPPARFRWRRALYEVAKAEGPERIAPEWWCAYPEEATRDYFHVEDADGRRYWLFRQGLYGAAQGNPRWFMQGLYA